MANAWKLVKIVPYTGIYDTSSADPRAKGGIVRIEERKNHRGVVQQRAITINGRYSFITIIKGDK